MLVSSYLHLSYSHSPHQHPLELHPHILLLKDASLIHYSARFATMASASRMTGSCDSGRMRGIVEVHQGVPRMSLPWQGNAAKHLQTMHLKRLVYCKVTGSLPGRASYVGPREVGNDRRQNTRRQASQMDASTLSLDFWSDEKGVEMILSQGGNDPYGTLGNGVTEGRHESFPEVESVKDYGTPDGNNLTVEGRHESRFEAESVKDSENETLGLSFAEHYLQGNLATLGPCAQEPKALFSHSPTSAEARAMNKIQASGAAHKHLTQEFEVGEHRAQSCEQPASASASAKGFWQILENDITFVKKVFKGFEEEGLPSLTETVKKVVTLRCWEDPSASQALNTPPHEPYLPGLSGVDLVAADFVAAKGYLQSALGWAKAWRIPLEPCYDPCMIANYFNRRPHVLLFRILQISAVFGSAIFQLELEKFLKPAEMNSENEAYAQRRGAELFKEALITLGPTFVKVGQSMSTRPDLTGSITAKVLSGLQDNLPPFSTRQAVSIIEEELGGAIKNIFSYLSEVPVAAASFGQVYKGRTIDGLDVAVKVQRPDLLHSVALDIYILRMALAVLRKIAKRRSDLKLYADELGHGFFGELDYIQEADNAMEFQEAHARLTFVDVPKTIRGLTTRRVHTMEWIQGDRPVDLMLVVEMPNPDGDVLLRERQLKAKQRLFSLTNKGVEASLVQLLDTGVLHADPHPGNLLYTEEGKMVFLDFGLVCRMEKRHQLAMLASVAHIVNADWDNFVQDLADMEILPAYVNRRAIALELLEALGDVVPQDGVPDIKVSQILVEVLGIALKYQFRMPPYFILVLRSIASLEGLALAVDPDFKVFASSYPFVLQRLLTNNSVPLRRVLSSLVLDNKKQFRWDRLASFATLAQQHTLKRIALETGMELQPVSVSGLNVKVVNPELIQLLINLLLSEKGVVFRQLILEADTFDLACVFNSSKTAALRKNVATAMASVFYQIGKVSFKEHANINLEDIQQLKSDSSASPAEMSQDTGIMSEKTMTEDFKSLTNCSDTLDISLLKSPQMQFLLQTVVMRLRRRPLLLMHTGWTSFTMFAYAVALAAHRLVVALCFKLLKSNAELTTRPGYQLVTA